MISLKDKVVAITGASGGMGKEICRALIKEGVKFLLCSNEVQGLNQLVDELEKEGAAVAAMEADITEEEQVKKFFELGKKEFGMIDILLNLAGVSIPAKVAEMDADKYDLSMDVNLKGTFLCSKHFIPCVDAERGGQIINIGSMAAKRANGNAPLYCTAKAAVNMFSEGLALQVKENNIRVTTLNPGPTDTAFWGNRAVPREKFMQASDVAELMVFILNMDARVVFHEVCFESFAFFK